jgi:hypothetical protein
MTRRPLTVLLMTAALLASACSADADEPVSGRRSPDGLRYRE